ncbi:MAG: hypothetical protein Q4D48_08870 [Coriobacteriales bacterium]|nr:hypothetical protein [Coriobacteriales bacterium]
MEKDMGLGKGIVSLRNGSDIRGVALEGVEGEQVNLTPDAARSIARGFLRWYGQRTGKTPDLMTVALGRDSRLSGPAIVGVVKEELLAHGVRVLDCGIATTPAMFMSCVFDEVKADASIMVTASHLPWNRNGLKFFTPDGGVESSDIVSITELAETDTPELPVVAEPADAEQLDLIGLYSAHLRKIICDQLGTDNPLAGLTVVVDAGNGAGGFYATQVLAPLGADVSGSQFLEPDGTFPNHVPNPENEQAMASITQKVRDTGADLGVIFDTDVDRSSAVDEHAREINRNAIVALAATLVAQDHPGTTIVTDSVTSDELTRFLEDGLGLKHMRYRRGYRNVINKMVELSAAGTACFLAIETSGHAAFMDNYALDDGAYLATLIVCAAARLKREGKGISELVAGLEEPAETREVRMRITDEDFRAKGAVVLEQCEEWVLNGARDAAAIAAGGPVAVTLVNPNYEGVRVNFSGAVNGWFLLRMSLHDPILPLNIESSEPGGVQAITATLRSFFEGIEGVDSSSL